MANDGGVCFAIGNREQHNEEGKPWYDTTQGIRGALASLETFTELVSERHTAGYTRKERLNEFYVLGRYSLDTCGNCGKLLDWIPKDNLPDLPDVMSRDAFWAYMKTNAKDGEKTAVSSSMTSDLPFGNIICSVCKKGWTIHNCHDTVVVHKTEVFPLADFEGKTLRDVKTAYRKRKDAHYQMQDDILVRNDRFIDLSPKYPGETEEWKQRLVKNERGWVSTRDGINDDYVIQTGDEGFFNVWTYYHHSCNRLNLAFTEETYFRDVFAKAGFNVAVLHHLPNGYCPCDKCAPWFKVETEVGPITLGWRKRVINIDWSKTPHKGKNIPALFSDEDVTKDNTSIHAWGQDKAIEYLSKIRVALSA